MNQIFEKKKITKDISANTIQTVVTQIFALVIFYFTSKYLTKNDFGEFNWSMGVGATIITLASLGLDVVYVKKVASAQNVLVVANIHFFHTVFVGLVLSSLIFFISLIFPSFKTEHSLFLIVFINLSLINIASSFRLCLMGLESYNFLAILALCTSLFRFILIITLYFTGYFTIMNVIYMFILSSLLELILGYFFATIRLKTTIKPKFKMGDYKNFVTESLPQLVVVFFDSALARIDWILLGILTTASVTADYSFAYRMYESSKLPLLVIAPILLTRFSKLFMDVNNLEEKNKEDIRIFFRLELFVIMIIPMVLTCSWSPLIDYFTDNKYGAVNELNYLLLAGCVPLHCMCNFLWSLGFAQGQLKSIMLITISVALLNIGINFLLIPKYGSTGSSLAFLISTIVQTLLYIKLMRQQLIKLDLKACFITFFNTIIAILIAKILTNNAIFASAIALFISTSLAFFTKQLSIKHLKRLRKS